MHNKKFFFVGSRFLVLDYMIQNHFNFAAIAIPQDKSYKNPNIKTLTFNEKEDLLKIITESDFDILVSNGCPYILPVTKIKKQHQIFINLHPSLLPDLKGPHPINGAIFYKNPRVQPVIL